MAALMDLRLFKLCLLVASILLMFLAAGVMVFGTKQGFIPANAVAVLSVMVWLGCVVSVICRRFRSKRPYEPIGRKAQRTATCETALSGGAWMLDPAARKLTSQIASESHFDRLVSGPAGSTLYGLVIREAGSDGPLHLVRLDEREGEVLQARTFEPRILQIAIGPSQRSLPRRVNTRPVAAQSQNFTDYARCALDCPLA